MRKERFQRGGRGTRGHGSQNGSGGPAAGDDRQGGGEHRRRGRGGPFNRQAFDSGNQRERIAVESGSLVFIDQFMLANPQFVSEFKEIVDESNDTKARLVVRYGGQVVDVSPGTYRIERDPFRTSIVVHPEGFSPKDQDVQNRAAPMNSYVFIDTRCVAMVDRELLDDGGLLDKYQQLWFAGQDKACRDLLRDNGGAVRYGFARTNDELGIYTIASEDVVCLWPDKTETSVEEVDAAAEG